MNRPFAALAVALFASALARADVAPPAGKKRVPVTTVVEVTEAFPDYVFVEAGSSTYYGSPPPTKDGSPSEPPGWRTDSWANRVHLAPGQPASRTGGFRDGATLYAIPKAAADAEGDANKLTRAVRENAIPGAAWVSFGSTRELPVADPRNAVTIQYRVARTPAGITFVDADAPTGDGPNDEPAVEVAGRAVPWRWVAAGGASSLAVVLAGVWVVWRIRKAA